MEETHHHRHSRRQTPLSRLGLRHGGGDIVEVQGGHIVRSTGRKDRHSKVCTAKGARDRRVRLSAHTAIQFYDVQDRLGYDRPSMAVDWLITKAKAAIDELDELPPWKPTSRSNAEVTISEQNQKEEEEESAEFDANALMGENSSNFMPPSMDSDAIADTIKSFFPTGAAVSADSSAVQFQSQDLRLSLQSFQDQNLLHHQQSQHHGANHQNEQVIFSGTTGVGYDAPSAAEISRFQRMTAWSDGGDASSGGGGGFVFNLPAQPFLGQNNQFVSQRGPLQSSNTQSIRAWIDPYSISATADHHHHGLGHPLQNLPMYQSSFSGIGFSGFRIPARIQGEEEEHDGVSDKPSSASSDSQH